MTLYVAYNAGVESAVTTLTAGQSFSTGARVALQVNVPDNQNIKVVEFGWSQDVATAAATLLSLQTTDTATTTGNAHSTTTVKPLLERDARASSMTMASASTGYGVATPASRTVLRVLSRLYVPQQYVYTYPLGNYPVVGAGTGESFLQLVVNTTAIVNGLCWIMWDES